MPEEKFAYCIACGQEQPYYTSSKLERMSIKGITFCALITYAYCSVCDGELYVPEINDENAINRQDAYRIAQLADQAAKTIVPDEKKNLGTKRRASMNSEQFEKIIGEQIETCKGILLKKAGEYATGGDRLHNFKAASGMMGCAPKEALAGMMAKHTISVYDMCRSGQSYPIELWNEKITDHINYLLLLKAAVVEEIQQEKNDA